MRFCKWSLRSHYEKQWGKRALMGEAAAQSLGSAAVCNRSRTRQLNGSRPPSAIAHYVMHKMIAGAADFVSARCSAFPWALAPFCGPTSSLPRDWKINKQITPVSTPSALSVSGRHCWCEWKYSWYDAFPVCTLYGLTCVCISCVGGCIGTYVHLCRGQRTTSSIIP